MSIAVNDVILRIGDHVGNLTTGQADNTQKLRAIDSAVNYLKRKIGFPQDEKKYSFLYSSDVLYYDLPTDFQEAITLNYNDVNFNNPSNYWDYRPYQEILARTGVLGGHNYWGHIVANADAHQLLLSGQNIHAPSLLDSFDNTLWTAGGDASSIALDTVTKIQGSASQKFTTTFSSGTATITSPTVAFDFRQLHENGGAFRVYRFIPGITGLTSIGIRYQSSVGNRYDITATTQADGSAFEANDWNLISFPTTSAVATGSPSLASINSIQFRDTIGVTFVTSTNCRIDYLYTVTPDELDLIYYSKYKGTNSTGATQKKIITAVSDIITLDEDFIEPISLKAALYLAPALLRDINFMQMYQSEFVDVIKTWARQWPRRRGENNYLRTVLRR